MAYNEQLAERVRQLLPARKVEEKKMMGGLTFMVNGKMCVGVHKNDLMVRLDPKVYDGTVKRAGARPMDFTGKSMRGFVFVGLRGTKQKRDLERWVRLGVDFNKKAEKSKG